MGPGTALLEASKCVGPGQERARGQTLFRAASQFGKKADLCMIFVTLRPHREIAGRTRRERMAESSGNFSVKRPAKNKEGKKTICDR